MASQDELNKKNEESLARQRATRESRAQEKEIKKQRREALNQATSTKERREIKRAAEEAILSTRGPSSAGGSDKGGIYDISTNNYSQPQRNQLGQDSSIEDAGIDTLGGSDDSGIDTNVFTLDVVKSDNTAGTATFNGSGVN